MSDLANHATNNGDIRGITYGSIPNDHITWDFDMIQSCLCDYPFIGYDCSMYECPFGDDPNTYKQNNEIQKLMCANSEGSFSLTFRGATTSPISAAVATGYDLETALESLNPYLDYPLDVLVYTDIGLGLKQYDNICAGGTFYVEFLYPNGDVPLFTVEEQGTQVIITEEIKGTTEWAECSLHGSCDRSTGECACFYGYTASDGQGSSGAIANCGYQLPYLS